jgi:malonyl-CoA O-methyltransferase
MAMPTHGTQQNFSRAAANYQQFAQFQHAQTQHVSTLAMAHIPAAATILDMGCGTGFFAETIRPLRPNWRMIGLDFALGMCQQAAQRCPVIQSNAESLPIMHGAVDAIVSSLCLQWVSDLPAAYAEMARVLKPGGIAVLNSLGEHTWSELRAAANHAALPLALLPMHSAHHYQSLAHNAGFLIEQFDHDMVCEYYEHVPALLHSARRIGAAIRTDQPAAGMGQVSRWRRMHSHYEQHRTQRGIPASWHCLKMVLRKPL